MAALKASAIPTISAHPYSSSPSPSSSSSRISFSSNLSSAIKLRISFSAPLLSLAPPSLSRDRGRLCSAVQEVSLEEASEQNQKKKLYIFNLPWSFSVVEIKELFGQCGTVTDVDVGASFFILCSDFALLFWVLDLMDFVRMCVSDYKAEKWKK